MRLSKTVANISEDLTETEPIETSYLNAVTNNHQRTTSWKIQVKVDGKAVLFVIDTGAEVSAISKDVYDANGRPRLYNPNKILCGPGRQVLNVLGCCMVTLSYKQHRVSQKVFGDYSPQGTNSSECSTDCRPSHCQEIFRPVPRFRHNEG